MNTNNISIAHHQTLSFRQNSPATVVPVVSTKSLSHAATPSRKRRIIYETARRITRQYINDAIENVHVQTYASQCIQRRWNLYQFKKSYHKALFHIHGLHMIYRAKTLLREKRKRHYATKTLFKFIQNWSATRRLTTQAAVTVQKLWRGSMARSQAQEYKLSLLEMECSAIVIQSFIRTYMAKLAFAQRHYPPFAIIIQRKYRSHLFQKRKKEEMMRIRNEASRTIDLWWKRMKLVQSLYNYALEEMRMRNMKRDDDLTNDEKCDDELSSECDRSSQSCNSQTRIEDVDPASQVDEDFGEDNDNFEDNDTNSDSSSITSKDTDYSIINSDGGNDESTICSASSKVSESSDIRKQKIKEAMELEYKRNQAASKIQLYFKSYVERLQQARKKRKEEAARRQLQVLREKSAAATLTNELWILFREFIQRRVQIKREREIQAAIKIQACIRKFIAVRFVSFFFNSVNIMATA